MAKQDTMWTTVRTALRSWALTGRLCLILTVLYAPAVAMALLR